MSTKRTDVHAPSSPDFDPAAYKYNGAFDLQDPMDNKARVQLVSRLVDAGYAFGGSGGGCGHCGAYIRYGALMTRADVMEMIYVGETCLDNRFDDNMTKSEFMQLRADAMLNRDRMKLSQKVEEFMTFYPELQRMNDYTDAESRLFNSIIADVAQYLQRKGSMSEKQIALVVKLMAQTDERLVRREQIDIEKAELLAAGVRAPEGRMEITGEIVSTKIVESDYGSTLKMVVKTDEGWAVWSTVPASIECASKGDRITFTATLEISDRDPLFAFAKRPTKAQILEVA
jgi:hypothetical protein